MSPPPPETKGPPGVLSKLKAFGQQSFSSRFYWFFYLMNSAGAVGSAVGMFQVFFQMRCMGLSRQQLGELGGYVGLAHLAATYVVSIYVDRWHPLRIMTYNAVSRGHGMGGRIVLGLRHPARGGLLLDLAFRRPGGHVRATLHEACGIPLFMRVMPKSLYGRFCSANSVIIPSPRWGPAC